MGLQDFETFIQDRLRSYDDTLDLTSGSPIDTQVIQPLLKRLGTDPFTVDAATFIVSRISQEFPDLAASDGDAVSDLLAKPALLLWDPIIREIQRVKNSLSFRDPSSLTADEADALGANLFAIRNTGSYARGRARMYFTQPQPISVNQANFFTSRSGLHYYPTQVQSIKAQEMQLNLESDLYYFDVNLVAEAPGDEYNIDPGSLVTVANVTSAVRVTNKNRFSAGVNAENAEEFIGRIDQSLSERSLVTTRGIAAQLTRAFPEVTRLNVTGFQDPEMQRDVITGGSLGNIIGFGTDAKTVPDGEFKALSRRLECASADFYDLIGPAGSVSNFVITLFGIFDTTPAARDLPVTRVLNATTIEVGEQVLKPGQVNKAWSLRKLELSLSGIPGGILFPQTDNGEITVPPDSVHIGGCTDILVRGSAFNAGSVVIDVLSDQNPLLDGNNATTSASSPYGLITLGDYVLGTNYAADGELYQSLVSAGEFNYSVEIIDGVDAGIYRILSVTQVTGGSPVLQVTPSPLGASGSFRWRLLEEISVDLVEPKQSRFSGATGKTIQNVDLFSTVPTVDFAALGVSVGDTLRIFDGILQEDYRVTAVNPPLYTQLQVDRPFATSKTGIKFSVFRPNSGGGVVRPLARITEVGLLDTSKQPSGAVVPYARPVQALSRAFQNVGNGIKATALDAVLGIVSNAQPPSGFAFIGAGQYINITWDGLASPLQVFFVGTKSAQQVVNLINAASNANPSILMDVAALITFGGSNFVGIVPVGPNTQVTGNGGFTVLFGSAGGTVRTSRDIRSASVDWASVDPVINADLDAIWVLDGVQSGFYSDPESILVSSVSQGIKVSYGFAPEVGRTVYIGSRSLGSARVYFLDPTSAEVDQGSVFTTVDVSGNILNFKPDPTLSRQILPALPNGSKPLNGACSNAGSVGVLTQTTTDFVLKGVKNGDFLHVDYRPIKGGTSLPDPIPGLALKQLRISLDNQPDKFITFMNDVGTAGAVSRDGVVEQINAVVGLNICSIVEITPGNFRIVFNPTLSLKVRAQSTNPASANTYLGLSDLVETTNESANYGVYQITQVGYLGDPTKLAVLGTFPSPGTTEEQFYVTRKGSQRIVSTSMQQQTEDGLYYWDVELVSEGPGNLWNIDAASEMVVKGYRSDGYYLTTSDPNTSLSTAESLNIHFSKSFLEAGVDDDPENATQLAGQSVSITYEYSSLVNNVQAFVSADNERVVNESALARHLLPHYVTFNLSYYGGSDPSVVLPLVNAYVQNLQPDQGVLVSDLMKIVTDKGAYRVDNPLNLRAVVHGFDRSVTLTRSQNSLTTGRLSAFVPDEISVTRKTG